MILAWVCPFNPSWDSCAMLVAEQSESAWSTLCYTWTKFMERKMYKYLDLEYKMKTCLKFIFKKYRYLKLLTNLRRI